MSRCQDAVRTASIRMDAIDAIAIPPNFPTQRTQHLTDCLSLCLFYCVGAQTNINWKSHESKLKILRI